jgi:hypothetical protein
MAQAPPGTVAVVHGNSEPAPSGSLVIVGPPEPMVSGMLTPMPDGTLRGANGVIYSRLHPSASAPLLTTQAVNVQVQQRNEVHNHAVVPESERDPRVAYAHGNCALCQQPAVDNRHGRVMRCADPCGATVLHPLCAQRSQFAGNPVGCVRCGEVFEVELRRGPVGQWGCRHWQVCGFYPFDISCVTIMKLLVLVIAYFLILPWFTGFAGKLSIYYIGETFVPSTNDTLPGLFEYNFFNQKEMDEINEALGRTESANSDGVPTSDGITGYYMSPFFPGIGEGTFKLWLSHVAIGINFQNTAGTGLLVAFIFYLIFKWIIDKCTNARPVRVHRRR